MRISRSLLIVMLASPMAAAAQVRVTVENDLFAPRRPSERPADYEYTAGTRVSWTSERAGWWAGRRRLDADSAARRRTVWEVGQEIYTPRNDAAEPLPGERPYAGWLYGSVSAVEMRPRRTRVLTLQLGATGPPSLAEPVQTTLHRLAGFRAPLGWAHQLAFEPGVVLRYGESRTLLAREGVELGPEWEAEMGNVLTGAKAGVRARAGGRRVYAVAAARGEWVARNLFLDGNTFRDGPRVEKRPFVAQAVAGAGARIGRVGIEYRAVIRGREYRTQTKPHAWGSISITLQ
ncbi:MAG TPA: lipid A deacylase LpxR family protein [Longimicrobiaceae bacterium]